MALNVTMTLNTTTSYINMTSDGVKDDYVYDYNSVSDEIPMAEFVPVSLIYGLTLVLGMVGNSLVIICITKYRRMHSVTNIFLVSLASADLLLVCACVPIKLVKWFTFTWWFGEVMCKIVHYLQNVSVICSVLTLTVMSLERYVAILRPMHARSSCTTSRAKKVVVLLWCLSFVIALPILKGQILKEVGEARKGFWCVKQWQQPIYEKIYELSMLIIILVFPLIAMIFAYSSICVELWIVTTRRVRMTARSQYHRSAPTTTSVTGGATAATVGDDHGGGTSSMTTVAPHNDDNKTRKQVIKMLVAIVVLFALCWAPSLIDNVLVAFGWLNRLHYDYLKHVRQAFALMSYFNSCVNPIVYAFMSRNFRNSFKNTLCACTRHGDSVIRGGGVDKRQGTNGRRGSFQHTTTQGTRHIGRGRDGRGRGGSGEGISMVYTQSDLRTDTNMIAGGRLYSNVKTMETFEATSNNFD